MIVSALRRTLTQLALALVSLPATAAPPPAEIPLFLKERAALYQQSPRQAALAWFDQARLGMFIHWGVWGKHHAAWAMFNQKIPLADYQQLAREVDASGFNAKEIVKLADEAWQRNFKKKAEIAVTSQGTWEWSPSNKCQAPEALWQMLAGAAANNANLLLNFGPKPDGSIPADVAANFRALGKRIAAEGYPPLNTTTYLKLRQRGAEVDATEQDKTAR